MKVGLVKSPNLGNTVRGGGFYERGLIDHLKFSDIQATITDPNHLSGFDLLHFLYFDPFFLTLPLIRPVKTIITIFDFTQVLFPELFPRGIRGEIKWQIQKQLVKTADHIITISNGSKKDIQKILNISADKITTTYLAPGDNYQPLKISKENIVLYIGDINANKNIKNLIQAFSLLKDKQTKLYLVGKAFLDQSLSESVVIKEQITSLGLTEKIVMPGYVSEQEKIKLLNKARVYVQPSTYEGFGLPVLEAMACGTPVICGKNSSLTEIVGDAATFANVLDPNDLAEKIAAVKATGQEVFQAKKFSWDKTASETKKVYEKILASR